MSTETVFLDPLTGAYSRTALQQRLAEEVERARRYKLDLSLLVIDLDHFKSINDAFRHTRGDQVLQEFVERVQAVLRGSDLLFRYGGDEFILLLPNTHKFQALTLAQRLLETIQVQPFAGDPPLTLSLSIGVGSFPDEAATPEALFEKADLRVLEAKRQGRGRVLGDDPAPAGRLAFETGSRLVEREAASRTLQKFLDELPEKKRGLLTVVGPWGAGRSRFLSEIGKVARLQGYAVLSLRASPALQTRVYGALAEAQLEWDDLPPPHMGAAVFAWVLRQHLTDKGQVGLLMTVDDLSELDWATLELLRELLFLPELPVAALAYTADKEDFRREPYLEAPLQATIEVEALSPAGLGLWLRSVLQWEAPEAFAHWLHRETGGLPAFLKRGLSYLVEQGMLKPATSRERLGLPDEVRYELRGLPFPEKAEAAGLENYSAALLFLQSARRAAPGFTLSDEAKPFVWRICQLVEGMPLGIELAAAWAPLFSCREIAEGIEHNLDFLASAPLATDAPGRQRSLRAVFDYFWNFLMEDERSALRKLVVFGGSFQREAARNVAGALPFFLSALVDRAFLSKTPAGRYTMHELLRQYAEEKLREAAPERAQARRRHGAYYLALAEQAEPELKGSQQAAWLERLEQEHDNFRAALDWAVTEGPAEAALRLSGALGPFWDVRGHWTEGRRWLRLALAEPDGLGRRTARAKALNAAGRLAFVQGDDLAAQTLFEAGLTLGRELSDPRSTVTSLTGLGGAASYQGRYPAARSLLAESLALWRALGDKPGIANALYSLGYVVLNLGDYSLANSLLRECLTLQRELGDKSGIAGVLNNLGEVARFQGDYELAADFYVEGLALYQELGNKGGIAWLLHNLGYVTQASSRDEAGRALALFKEALFLFRELGNKQGIAACLAGMAGVVGGAGKPERAARLFGAAEALLEASGAVLDSVDRIAYERNVAAVRRRASARGEGDAYLDEASFTAAWAEGRTMTMEAAMAYALENDTRNVMRDT